MSFSRPPFSSCCADGGALRARRGSSPYVSTGDYLAGRKPRSVGCGTELAGDLGKRTFARVRAYVCPARGAPGRITRCHHFDRPRRSPDGMLRRFERHKNRRRLAGLDNIGRVHRVTAISRNKPQQSNRTRDVGYRAKRHLLRTAGKYHAAAVLRPSEREICVDGGMLNLCPTSEVPAGRRRASVSTAEIEVDEGRVIGSVQSHVECEEDQGSFARSDGSGQLVISRFSGTAPASTW
jgi:hypothetical protein